MLYNDVLSIIFSYLHNLQDWKNVKLSCKYFKEIGYQAFDPSIKDNRAIQYSCGYN